MVRVLVFFLRMRLQIESNPWLYLRAAFGLWYRLLVQGKMGRWERGGEGECEKSLHIGAWRWGYLLFWGTG